jgi:FkbH-like protein
MLRIALTDLDAEVYLSNLFELGSGIRAKTNNSFCRFELNRKVDVVFHEFLKENDFVYYLDVESAIREIGLEKSWNKPQDYLFRQPLSLQLSNCLVNKMLNLVQKNDFTGIKIIATDADGTLWKGVIGENGETEIEVGRDYPGRVYFNYQMFLKGKKESGIILALVTKNNPQDIIDFFSARPDMPLRLEDFTIIKASWESKAKSILEISNETKVLMDSILFIDDSEIEIDVVNKSLPEVTTLLLSKKDEDRELQLAELPIKWSGGSTYEDLNRTEMLKANLIRKEILENSHPVDFLDNLNLELSIGVISSREDTRFERILQLINKTNQFNMTALRYTAEELTFIIQNGTVFYAELRDRFGEYGLIAVAIIEYENTNTAVILNYLLSCRALGRKVEEIFFQEIIKSSYFEGFENFKAIRRTTTKNQQTNNFYVNFGFQSKLSPKEFDNEEVSHCLRERLTFKEYPVKVMWI